MPLVVDEQDCCASLVIMVYTDPLNPLVGQLRNGQYSLISDGSQSISRISKRQCKVATSFPITREFTSHPNKAPRTCDEGPALNPSLMTLYSKGNPNVHVHVGCIKNGHGSLNFADAHGPKKSFPFANCFAQWLYVRIALGLGLAWRGYWMSTVQSVCHPSTV